MLNNDFNLLSVFTNILGELIPSQILLFTRASHFNCLTCFSKMPELYFQMFIQHLFIQMSKWHIKCNICIKTSFSLLNSTKHHFYPSFPHYGEDNRIPLGICLGFPHYFFFTTKPLANFTGYALAMSY